MKDSSRLMFVWPLVTVSIYDVATGIYSAFERQNVKLGNFKLFNRIQICGAGFSQVTPEGYVASTEQICLFACEALPYQVISQNTEWVFIICGMGVHPNALAALRRIGVKIACWFTEAPYVSDEEQEFNIAKLVDVAFINERTVVDKFQEIMRPGAKAYYIPHAYNPVVHHPPEIVPEKEIDVTFVGTGFADRQMLFESMNFEGINFHMGGYWNYITEPNHLAKYMKSLDVPNKDLIDIYNKSKIVFNPHRDYEHAESMGPRTYEVAATKNFQISSYRQEIKDIFGDCIPMYEPGVFWQAEALLRKMLKDKSYREACAEEAYEKVQSHTFDARAKFIMERLE